MPRLLIEDEDGSRRAVLVASTLLGRHWRCDVGLGAPSVPLYWLEIRWSGSHWAWRCLGAPDQTLGRGRADVSGWRRLDVGDTIELRGAGTWIRLADGGPPQVVLQSSKGDRWLDGEGRFEHLVLTRDGARALGPTGVPVGPVLGDGDELLSGGQRWRVHVPGTLAPTLGTGLSLDRGPLSLDFDLSVPVVVVSTPLGEARVQSSVVRTLAAYAAAHQPAHGCPGGWLSNPQAQAWTLALGAAAGRLPERLNWDRARLRSQLRELGVHGTDRLFERHREGGIWFHRLRRVPQATGLPDQLPALEGPRLGRGLAPDPAP